MCVPTYHVCDRQPVITVSLLGGIKQIILFIIFSSSVTYPAMGISPLLPECYGTIDNPGKCDQESRARLKDSGDGEARIDEVALRNATS